MSDDSCSSDGEGGVAFATAATSTAANNHDQKQPYSNVSMPEQTISSSATGTQLQPHSEILIISDDEIGPEIHAAAAHNFRHQCDTDFDITSDDDHPDHPDYSPAPARDSSLLLPPKTPKESVSWRGAGGYQQLGMSSGGEGMIGLLPPRTPAAAVVMAGEE
jgi:hypothetical protein